MISLIPIYYDAFLCNKIADERNNNLKTLRTSRLTHFDQQKKWIEGIVDDKGNQYLYIRDYDVVGYCGFDKMDSINRTAEISCLVFKDEQKKGYGKKAIRELLKYGFSDLRLNCIFAEVYKTTDNWKFWKSCGFIKEGILRERKFWKGKYYNSIIASILKGEYNGQR